MIRFAASLLNPSPVAADDFQESYRALLHRVRQALGEPERMLVGVTSANRGEGVSTVCANLAITAARLLETPTLIVDANPRRACMDSLFSLERTGGLAEILHGAATPDCIQPTAYPHLSVIAAGSESRRDRPISPTAFDMLVRGLQDKYPAIFVDLPAASDSGDCPALCGKLDGIALVVQAERVRNKIVCHVKDQLLDADAKVLGVVFNRQQRHVPQWIYSRL